ncbi:hypothetical protein Tco_0713276 [Tanacetum coccineum]
MMIQLMRTLQNLKLQLNQKVPPPNPEKVATHKVVTQKVQIKSFPAKSPVPFKDLPTSLCNNSYIACIGNKTFRIRKPKDAIVADQDRKGKRKSCGCLLLVCKDDISSKEFIIYEMMKGCYVWSIRYLVNTEELINPLPEGWSIQSTVWSIGLVEREEDAF